MPMTQVAQRYTNLKLLPVVGSPKPVELAINIGPSATIAKGTVLAQAGAAAADVQTISISGGAGTFVLTGVNPLTGASFTTSALAYNIPVSTTATNLQATLRALFGPGSANVAVTGTAGTSYVVTFGGNLANMPIQLMGITGASGATATIAHTTTGVTAGTFVAYSNVVLTPPTVAPTVVVGTGVTDPPIASAVPTLWQYTYYNANGETTPSPAAQLTPDGTHQPSISSIAVPSGATGIRYYANGNRVTSVTTAGAVVLTQALLTTSLSAAQVPTANTTGTGIALCLAAYDMATDAFGAITMGAASGGGEWGQTYQALAAYFSGWFLTSQLVGLDANAVAQLGKLKSGTISAGVLDIN